MIHANLADGLTERAARYPDAPAIALERETITFARLEGLVWSCAAHLSANGVTRGRRVTTLLSDELTTLIALFAFARLGATCMTLPPDTPMPLLDEILRRTRSDLLACGPGIRPQAPRCPMLHLGRADYAFGATKARPELRDPAPAAPMLVIAGSGSTGRSKYFAVTHAQFGHCVRLCAQALSISASDRLASMVHMLFTSPKERALATLYAGGCVVFADLRGADVADALQRHHVTILDATVFHAHRLLGSAKTRPALPSKLRVLQLSGSIVTEALRRRILTELTPNLWIRYGTNETGVIAICPPELLLSVQGTVGRVHPGVQLELVDADGTPVVPGQPGRVRLRTPGMTEAYIDDEEATRLAFRDGWFHPGDMAVFGPEGQLSYRGRADQMMIFNGVNIYPAQIETVVGSHPAVRDCVAFPMFNRTSQDVPVCAVALRSGQTASEEELRAFCRDRLGHQAPVRVFVLDAIPRTEQGKPIRAELAREAMRWIGEGPARGRTKNSGAR